MENKRVFIVHGRDGELRDEVKAFLKENGWEPVILAEQASLGRTIIEKIEDYADVKFAVVLYTGCDVGALKGNLQYKPRARQNVVLEHGFFIGRLGRERVFAITDKDVEFPNDLAGVVYISRENDWRAELSKEMATAANLPSYSVHSELETWLSLHKHIAETWDTYSDSIREVDALEYLNDELNEGQTSCTSSAGAQAWFAELRYPDSYDEESHADFLKYVKKIYSALSPWFAPLKNVILAWFSQYPDESQWETDMCSLRDFMRDEEMEAALSFCLLCSGLAERFPQSSNFCEEQCIQALRISTYSAMVIKGGVQSGDISRFIAESVPSLALKYAPDYPTS